MKKNISYGKNVYDNNEIQAVVKTLKKSTQMGVSVDNFEKKVSKLCGKKYGLMVNSGSSALILAIKSLNLKNGSEIITPCLNFGTTISSILLNCCIPILVDVNIRTLQIDIDILEKKISKKTKAIMLINVLGNSSDLFKIKKIAKKNKLIIIEDNCESLGSKLKKKYLGSFGDFGTFSFYYSHQITSGEGGMVVCKTREDYEILFALRSHGWLGGTRFYKRNLSKYNLYAKKNPKLDPRYIFINSGFNLRPTDIQAAIAHNQFKRLENLKKNREINRKLIIKKLKKSKLWKNQFEFINPSKNINPSWMGLPILISKKFKHKKKKFINFLDQAGIETRPIISGSFINQPASKLYNLNPKNEKFKNAQIIQDLGFIIGLHTKKISYKQLNFIHDNFFMIDKI